MELPSPLLGVDVCKVHLDACLLHPCGRREERRFANDGRGIAALLAWGKEARALGMESTGGHERKLALAGLAAGRLVRVENPRRVHDYAKAAARLNKTDRADARAIAEFLGKFEGRPYRLAGPAVRELEGLTSHRVSLLEERTRLANRLEWASTMPPLVVRQLKDRLGALEAEIREVEGERRRVVKADEGLTRDLRALVRLTGVGEATATLVLARAGNVEDYPTAEGYAAAAGLNPCRRESGGWRGKSRISKQGDAPLRSGLFMAAVVASGRDPLMRALRDRLRERGKSPLQAVVAVMRKLLMRMYGVLKAVRAGKEPFYGERPRAQKQAED